MNAIEIRNLYKNFRTFNTREKSLPRSLISRLKFERKKKYTEFAALKEINIDIKKGETIGFIGQNGSGKSTLLRLIAGILSADSGSVSVNGSIGTL